MAPIERLYDRGTRRAAKALSELGEEFRHARLRLGLTQREVAQATRVDRADYSRIEAGKLRLSVIGAYRVGAILGLDVSMRAFPGAGSIRDAGHAKLEQKLIACVGAPLSYRIEVPLPRVGDRPEQRSWDLMLFGHGERTAVEFERRLYDMQLQVRRFEAKRRDDPVEHFLLVVADMPANRRVLAEFPELLADMPRLATAAVLQSLRAGHHPPTGLILLEAPIPRAKPAPNVEHFHEPEANVVRGPR